MTEYVEKLPLTSLDITRDRVAALREAFPDVFREGKIDFDALKQALGEEVDTGPERYGLSWAGKAGAIRNLQTPSIATLVPDREESIDFDSTGNVFIEGENLEVLKLLQQAYYGKVKMIYIDPPYNTGHEFIYPDNFREPLDTYLRYSGQIDGDGLKMSTNTETGGRYHSNWLNMMYPRLFLARNLLREDGVIFVSIDDHEVHNLRLLMNEVFGEENFIATIVWQKVYAPKNTARHFSEDHDFILAYARSAESWRPHLLPRSDEANARYLNPDADPRGPWKPSDLTARNFYGQGQYEVVGPTGKKFRSGVGRYWRSSYETFQKLDQDGRVWWGETGNNMPAQKRFLAEVQQGMTPQTLWAYSEVGHTQEAKKELIAHVEFAENSNVLNSVKPSRLVRRMLQIATQPDSGDIVLDFFAGSATTCHAVMDQNHTDGGNRQFICVQIPEPLPTVERRLSTIADIGKERIRRVGAKLRAEREGQLPLESTPQDLGFKVFKLSTSNFRVWEAMTDQTPERLARQLELHVDHIEPGATQERIFYEILLKSGFALTAAVEQVTVVGKVCFAVAGGLLLVCLEETVTEETIRGMIARRPQQIVCLDAAFHGNDQLKTNTVLQMRDAEIVFHTV